MHGKGFLNIPKINSTFKNKKHFKIMFFIFMTNCELFYLKINIAIGKSIKKYINKDFDKNYIESSQLDLYCKQIPFASFPVVHYNMWMAYIWADRRALGGAFSLTRE